MFGTSLLDEYKRARDVLKLHQNDLLTLIAQGVEASFAPDSLKKQMIAEISTHR